MSCVLRIAAEKDLTPYYGTGFILKNGEEERIMDGLTIGRVAKRAGVGVETIRFYERQGLLEDPPRRASGYRQYPDEAVARIRFIRRAKDLGFSLREVQELLNLRVDEKTSPSEVRSRAEAKIGAIELKIADLERMKQALTELTACCSGRGPIGECPILEAMERNQKPEKTEKREQGGH